MTNNSEVETLAIQPHKLLILDARSYAAAVANRAKGGGCECPGGSPLPLLTHRGGETHAVCSSNHVLALPAVTWRQEVFTS